MKDILYITLKLKVQAVQNVSIQNDLTWKTIKIFYNQWSIQNWRNWTASAGPEVRLSYQSHMIYPVHIWIIFLWMRTSKKVTQMTWATHFQRWWLVCVWWLGWQKLLVKQHTCTYIVCGHTFLHCCYVITGNIITIASGNCSSQLDTVSSLEDNSCNVLLWITCYIWKMWRINCTLSFFRNLFYGK